ncbi:hypothetical protein [Kingella denitrificans]|uniref:hypothetical protein n=1 Tax=Kingella denitrificans TaxID=502 RepID=UPI0028D8E7DF|nr:hypothetical protein [Kingella denitrificans]
MKHLLLTIIGATTLAACATPDYTDTRPEARAQKSSAPYVRTHKQPDGQIKVEIATPQP